MKKKKSRHPIISPSFDKHVEIAGFDLTNGVFSFLDANGDKLIPETVTIGDGYQRDSGKAKVINQVEVSGDNINLNPNDRLHSYDWLFAIDTNKKDYNGISISLACSAFIDIELEELKSIDGVMKQNWDAKMVVQDAYVFSNPKINPELIGWQELTNRIIRTDAYNDKLRIGIIVDSELGELKKINRRERPLVGNAFLPGNFEFVYASSDVGQEYPHNKCLKLCDTTANTAWKYLIKNHEIIDNMVKDTNEYVDSGVILKAGLMQELYKKTKSIAY